MEAEVAASTTLTVRVSEDLKARLGRLAEITDRTQSFLAGEAIEEFVARELEICEGILRGMADFEAGRVISDEEMKRRTNELLDRAFAEEAARTAAE